MEQPQFKMAVFFDYQQSRSLQAILNDTDLCNDIMPEEAADIIKNILIRSKDRFPALFLFGNL